MNDIFWRSNQQSGGVETEPRNNVNSQGTNNASRNSASLRTLEGCFWLATFKSVNF